MDPEILAAIIIGVSGLGSGVAVAYKDEILSRFRKTERDITGTWVGKAADVEVPGEFEYDHPLEYKATAHLEQTGAAVRGRLSVESDRVSQVDVSGELRGEYLAVQYKNLDSATEDWGLALLQIKGTGRDMAGAFVGRRMREHGMAIGTMTFTKQ